jgi:hypothetical protein
MWSKENFAKLGPNYQPLLNVAVMKVWSWVPTSSVLSYYLLLQCSTQYEVANTYKASKAYLTFKAGLQTYNDWIFDIRNRWTTYTDPKVN